VNIVIRADASQYIGSGHIMRCLVLAKALAKSGYCIRFACRRQVGDLFDLLEARGFEVIELVSPSDFCVPNDDKDYAAWLQVPWQQDADSLLTQIGQIDLLIVDHYGINIEWEVYVKARLACKLFVIDDLVRTHSADLLLDQTLMREVQEYGNISSTRILVGCDHALLADNFPDLREKVLDKNEDIKRPKLLLSMGAMDLANITLKVLSVFSHFKKSERPFITVLLSPRAPHYQTVRNFCQINSDWIRFIDFVDDMAELMNSQDVAVGAGGTTSWERACLGIPSIVIPLASNQINSCEKLASLHAAITMEISEIEAGLSEQYNLLIKKFRAYRRSALAICDGLGLMRVLYELKNLLNDKLTTLTLRKANEDDIEQVFHWQIQPETRKFALNPAVPTWEEHDKWMRLKLACVDHFFYMIDDIKGKSIGVVRLDRLKICEYVISIFIDPTEYGNGYASQALSMIDSIHSRITIHASVLKENSASQRLFLAANYKRVSNEAFIRDPIH
jgi:UDP-2,4-diacetamido-2,4,6-trideoxy-beta-L-altropyranose hydrolase